MTKKKKKQQQKLEKKKRWKNRTAELHCSIQEHRKLLILPKLYSFRPSKEQNSEFQAIQKQKLKLMNGCDVRLLTVNKTANSKAEAIRNRKP